MDILVGISELTNKTAEPTDLILTSGEITADLFRDTLGLGTEPRKFHCLNFHFNLCQKF